MMEDRTLRWRLVLGNDADPDKGIPLNQEASGMDQVLTALYGGERSKGLGNSSPKINRWLGDIRKYFPVPVVQLMQKDALDRLGLTRMLIEPELLETVEVDVHLVATLLSLNKIMSAETRTTARSVIRKIVQEIERKLSLPLQKAVEGALNRATRQYRPRLREINWHQTIQANLKHYQPELKNIIPERFIGYGKKNRQLRRIIILMDQSGSMAPSVVYAGIAACVLAELKSVSTKLIAFDTAVVDLSDHLHDPVEVLFATQLGGGTDIGKALQYAETLIEQPAETIVVLISDLYEGGNAATMLRRAAAIKTSGVQMIALLALSDEGAPAYDHDMAQLFAQLDIPAFACTPDLFPELMAAAIQKEDIHLWMARRGLARKN